MQVESRVNGEHSNLVMAICVDCKTTTFSYVAKSIQERCMIEIINDLNVLIFVNVIDTRTDRSPQRRQAFFFFWSLEIFTNDVRLLHGFRYEIGALSYC